MSKNQELEQQRVEAVTALIAKRLEAYGEQAELLKSEVVHIRRTFWDDVTVNMEDADEAIETYASMKQQAEVLAERERNHRQLTRQLQLLIRMKRSPYFGRIDFVEHGESGESEPLYIGTGSLLDDSGLSFLVYDWRAPVSSLYYDYGPGEAQYETPSGAIHGEITLKRQYVIRDGVIRSMFDTGVTIGDELLQEVLGKQSDAQMRSIVATIQREQNRIIRNERARLLIVQGAAGSGKTSAALQRVAYLLYRYRETLSADQIVLFSPNPMFNSYVATVLPELGEDNMQQATFQEYVERRLGDSLNIETPFEQMETVLEGEESREIQTRLSAIRFKSSAAFVELLDAYASYLGREGLRFHDVKFRDEIIVPKMRLYEKFYETGTGLTLPNRMVALTEWLLHELRRLAKLERSKPWVEDEVELLDKEEYVHAYRQLQKKKQFSEMTFDDFEREAALLAAYVVQRAFKGLRAEAKRLAFLDAPAVYRQLFEPGMAAIVAPDISLPPDWASICRQTEERLAQANLANEDATPYMYLLEKLEGVRTNGTVRHVFVDEAQDYSPFQFTVLRRLFPRARLTVLGDLNQAIHPFAAGGENGFAALSQMFDPDETERIMLQRSYRSTREIVDFTRSFVPGGESIERFNREGEKPRVISVPDRQRLARSVASCVERMQEGGHRSIAVICKTAAESREAFEQLQPLLQPLTRIDAEASVFAPGTVVIPSYLAKGVEFDGVVLFNASREVYGRESERKLFYTACTRAMHELAVCCVGEMSPFVAEVPSELYEAVAAAEETSL